MSGLLALSNKLIPSFILVNFLVLLILIWLNKAHIRKFLSRLDRRTLIILSFIFIAALLIRIYVPVHSHLMYSDEALYMKAASGMLRTGSQGLYPKSIGWPFIIAIGFAFFGINNWVAINITIALGALTVFTVFLLAYALTNDTWTGLIAAVILALEPAHLSWSATAETNVPSIFFITLVMFFCVLYFREKKKRQKDSLLYLSLAGIAFLCQFRPENYLFVAVFGIGFLLFSKINMRTVLPWLILALALPNFFQVLQFQQSTNWVSLQTLGKEDGSNWSIGNLVSNTVDFGPDLFNGKSMPLMVTLFMILGILLLFRERWKEALFLSSWFVVMWMGVFGSWIRVLQTKERFYLILVVLIAIVSAYGISELSRRISARRYSYVVISIIALLVLFSVPYAMGSRLLYADDAHHLETMIPEMAQRDIPQNCTIVAYWPEVIQSTTDLHVIGIEDYIYESLDTSCSLFFDDLSCEMVKEFNETCNLIRDRYKLTVYKSYSKGRENFTFYRIGPKMDVIQ